MNWQIASFSIFSHFYSIVKIRCLYAFYLIVLTVKFKWIRSGTKEVMNNNEEILKPEERESNV